MIMSRIPLLIFLSLKAATVNCQTPSSGDSSRHVSIRVVTSPPKPDQSTDTIRKAWLDASKEPEAPVKKPRVKTSASRPPALETLRKKADTLSVPETKTEALPYLPREVASEKKTGAIPVELKKAESSVKLYYLLAGLLVFSAISIVALFDFRKR